MTQLIFVYGSLKRGYELHRYLQWEQFQGEAHTEPAYRLVDCGSYPGLLSAKDGHAIHGEVYLVSDETLQVLDEVEGVEEDLYRRAAVRLQPPFDQQDVQAWFYNQPTDHLPDCGNRWPRGSN
ncbi:MAG: gamma-glutamylcyclotransferase [Fuerstiella sp.]